MQAIATSQSAALTKRSYELIAMSKELLATSREILADSRKRKLEIELRLAKNRALESAGQSTICLP
jgi:hypothetical protein